MDAKGFTLLNLIFTLLIISVLLGIAFPSFSTIYDKNLLASTNSRLAHTIRLARIESITHKKYVVVCATTDAIQCTTDWSQGYMAFVDADNNGVVSNGDTLLTREHKLQKNLSIRWRSFSGQRPIVFIPLGVTQSHNGTFVVCVQRNTAQQPLVKALIMARTGRLRQAKDKNGDGIPENSRGKPYRCS